MVTCSFEVLQPKMNVIERAKDENLDFRRLDCTRNHLEQNQFLFKASPSNEYERFSREFDPVDESL